LAQIKFQKLNIRRRLVELGLKVKNQILPPEEMRTSKKPRESKLIETDD
jgi:hypothetical protein